ncbi:Ubiquitin carboxyl-terminal hydrolase isozyme L3 [Fusarium oxysporum f. sp. albedinis]|nr:Ubiquitin carboxyl-terminal hydrolase isozyme L3 [Fusarium oxysporum f. sp. albedinis]
MLTQSGYIQGQLKQPVEHYHRFLPAHSHRRRYPGVSKRSPHILHIKQPAKHCHSILPAHLYPHLCASSRRWHIQVRKNMHYLMHSAFAIIPTYK